MSEEPLGYIQAPKNTNGIIRSRTTGQLRAWNFERSSKGLEKINENEWGKIEFPGIYILFEHKKVYIGEAKCIYTRMKTHINEPEDKIKNWERVLIINDGRPATQSDLNDIVVRRCLENHLISLFKLNKYVVVSQGSDQQVTSIQKTTVDNLINELNFFLKKENLITKLLPDVGQEEIHKDELEKIIKNSGKKIKKWGAYEAVIDSDRVFIRPGSFKKKGWQITFRDVFKDALKNGKGSLLVSRGKVPFIPFTEIHKVIKDAAKYDQNTIDIYLQFSEGGVTLSYMEESIDVSGFCLIKE